MPRTRSTNLLQRGLRILEVFSGKQPRLRLQDVVESSALPKSTASRILKTLVSLNYLQFDNDSKKYFLGPKVLHLGHRYLSGLDVRRVALPYLEELSRLTDQNVNLGILDASKVLYIESIKRRRIINAEFRIGMRLKSWQTSVGRSILAFLDEDKLEALLKEFLTDPKAREYIGSKGERLIENLEDVRRKGYALDDEQFVQGLRTAGAPIFGGKGQPIGGISVLVLAQVVSRDELVDHFVPLLLDTSREISSVFGFVRA
jgi:DNA-binding IclR family transcriptional regulator